MMMMLTMNTISKVCALVVDELLLCFVLMDGCVDMLD